MKKNISKMLVFTLILVGLSGVNYKGNVNVPQEAVQSINQSVDDYIISPYYFIKDAQ